MFTTDVPLVLDPGTYTFQFKFLDSTGGIVGGTGGAASLLSVIIE